jgi:hypothetical protein
MMPVGAIPEFFGCRVWSFVVVSFPGIPAVADGVNVLDDAVDGATVVLCVESGLRMSL